MKWLFVALETGAAAACVALAIAYAGLAVEPAAWILCGLCVFAAILSIVFERKE